MLNREPAAQGRTSRRRAERFPMSEKTNELLQLMNRVHDELGPDAYEAACLRAGALAKKSTLRIDAAVSSAAGQTVNVGVNEPYVIPRSVYQETLKTELRRLLQPH